MALTLVQKKADWYTGDTAQGRVEFLQSWDYGELLKEAGRTIVRLRDSEGEFLQAQCVVNKTRFGTYAYVPRVFLTQTGMEKIVKYFKELGYFAVRFETLNDLRHPEPVATGEGTPVHSNDGQGVLRLPRLRSSVAQGDVAMKEVPNAQPEHIWLLDLTPSVETLLANMHQKTRYNIRVSERHGVQIKQEKNLEIAWKLNQITTDRNQYKNNPKSFFSVLLKNSMTEQFTAYFENEPIATAILLRYKDTMIYLFGASANDGRNTMAPNLLQWQMIKYAKSVGCAYYDWLGVATPVDKNSDAEKKCFHHFCWDPNHPYSGVSRFKAGYNGFVKSYPKAFDVILSRWKYFLFRWLRRRS